MKNVAFLVKPNNPHALACAASLATSLRDRHPHWTLWLLQQTNEQVPGLRTVPETQCPRDVDVLVTLGGDGTLLHATSLFPAQAPPMLGINLGHLGFLSASLPAQALPALEAAVDGTLPLETHQRLQARVYRGSRVPTNHVLPELATSQLLAERVALNDVVLRQPALVRLLALEAFVDGAWVTTYRADGLIVATPTGSTAYNLAAGGPIMWPALSGLVLTPICSHTLTARPVVLPSTVEVVVHPKPPHPVALVTVDGQWSHTLVATDWVALSQAPYPIRLFRANDHSFFDLLRSKLHWGTGG